MAKLPKSGRLGKLSHISFAMERIKEPIAEVPIIGCPVQIRDGTNVNIYFDIGNFCADIPAQHDMLCVKYSNKTNEPFSRCHIEQDIMETYSKSKIRTLEERLGFLGLYQ